MTVKELIEELKKYPEDMETAYIYHNDGVLQQYFLIDETVINIMNVRWCENDIRKTLVLG